MTTTFTLLVNRSDDTSSGFGLAWGQKTGHEVSIVGDRTNVCRVNVKQSIQFDMTITHAENSRDFMTFPPTGSYSMAIKLTLI